MVQRDREAKADRLTIGQRVHSRPSGRERPAVGGDREPRGEHRPQRRGAGREDGGIEQPFRRRDVQIVADVEHVRDERAVNGARLDPKVQIAEGYRMCGGAPAHQKQGCCNQRSSPELA